jgi:hypothetical protein
MSKEVQILSFIEISENWRCCRKINQSDASSPNWYAQKLLLANLAEIMVREGYWWIFVQIDKELKEFTLWRTDVRMPRPPNWNISYCLEFYVTHLKHFQKTRENLNFRFIPYLKNTCALVRFQISKVSAMFLDFFDWIHGIKRT